MNIHCYTPKSISKHKTVDDAWISIHGNVYDITNFITVHPGGEDVLVESAGSDATACFDSIGHSDEAYKLMNDLKIGTLSDKDKHPGGEEVLLEQAGKDSTEEFEDVGHSSDAREVMQKYKIGELIDEDRKQNKKPEKKSQPTISSNGSPDDFSIWKSWLLPLTIGVLAIFVYRYFITS
ncbi:cytochrome b5 isoform X1 [Daktulosphaira vitifoliae]|uniref:cytochrome b5 isoform X1 n=1 Tax=Daktulosphaira vitifoliae TaxID=58002 RepID=UPI0021AAAD42|nr:cytochrome b5 isoform X1 [Daktulosphaira vitifoliae]